MRGGSEEIHAHAEETPLLPVHANKNESPRIGTGRRVAAAVATAVSLIVVGAVVTTSPKRVKNAESAGKSIMSSLSRVWARGFDQYFNPVMDVPGMEGWLDCSVYDDDSIFPDEAGCYSNDWGVYCGEDPARTCNSINGTCYLSEEICHTACLMNGSNFGFVCMYQALASLRDVCENKFVPSLPSGKNLGPSLSTELNSLTFDSAMKKGNWLTQATVGSGETEDPCAYHAFCSNCISGSASTEWTTNTECWEGAVIEGLSGKFNGDLAVQHVIEKLDFYCQSDVLEKFEAGELSAILRGDSVDTAGIRKRYVNAGKEKYDFPPASADTIEDRKDLCFELAGDAAEELCETA